MQQLLTPQNLLLLIGGAALIGIILTLAVYLLQRSFGRNLKTGKPRTAKIRVEDEAAFVERGLELLRPGGYLGAITSRTGFFLKSFQAWREEILLKEAQVIAMVDLGYGVLDTAMVETAAYVIQKG